MKRFDAIIIGAGLAGLSTAYHLAKSGEKNTLVLEAEHQVGGHASGRNAGMIRQAIKDPMIARLAVEGSQALRRASRGSWKGLTYRANGSLLLSMHSNHPELIQTEKTLRRLGVATKRLTLAEAQKKVSILSISRCNHMLFSPSDGLVELEPLLNGFLVELKKHKVAMRLGVMPSGMTATNGGYIVTVGEEKVWARKIVNAAGAWCPYIAKLSGATALPLKAYRRHLFYATAPSWMRQDWPFVWDIDLDFYFRPCGKEIMVSPCDKKEVAAYQQKTPREVIEASAKKLLDKKKRLFSSFFNSVKPNRAKSGLRTMAPDGRFVIGGDPGLKGFYWVAGLGGHGVTTCFSVGKLASDIILSRSVDRAIKEAFDPKRLIRS